MGLKAYLSGSPACARVEDDGAEETAAIRSQVLQFRRKGPAGRSIDEGERPSRRELRTREPSRGASAAPRLRHRLRPVSRATELLDKEVCRRVRVRQSALSLCQPQAVMRCSSASTRAKPLFAPSSTPYCIVVSRSSVVSKRIVCVSLVCSPSSSNSSVWRWF